MINRILSGMYSTIGYMPQPKQETRIKLLPETEAWLLRVAPKHFASENSPTTFEAVKKQAEPYGIYHVFNGGSTDTIFSERKYQYAYRAWHDSIHLRQNLSFGVPNELKVAVIQEQIALACSVDAHDAKLLRLDLEAHISYLVAKGEHPVHQLDLIRDCMDNGIEATVNSTKLYH